MVKKNLDCDFNSALQILIIIVFLIASFIPSVAFGQKDFTIKLKSRHFTPPVDSSSFIESKLTSASLERVHVVIQFQELPDASTKANLKKIGVKLLGYIPNNAWFVSVPKNLYSNLPELSSVRWIGEIKPEDKISQSLSSNTNYKEERNINGNIRLVIVLFKDVNKEYAKNMLNKYSTKIQGPGMINDYIIKIKYYQILELAKEDFVQWIDQVPPPEKHHNDGSRESTNVNAVQSSPYDLNGANVDVGIWDGGAIDDTHDDLQGRVSIVETDPDDDHATHVAGTLGGDGTLSEGEGGTPLQWRGMAPEVEIFSYNYLHDDLEPEEHDQAINTNGIDVSQNSWGVTVVFDDPLFGNYTLRSSRYDNVVRGVYGRGIPVIFAAGNEQQWVTGSYGSITPPGGTAKNTITVGAINSNDDTMTTFSSWGPVDDGRIKPDLVAPGCEDDLNRDDDDPNRTIWSTIPGDTYYGMCGTSMAAPVVSGISALMIEEFRNQTGIDPLPSTVKAILINTAEDLPPAGPDYATGFGKVDAKASVDTIIAGNYGEGSFDGTNGVTTYALSVSSGAPTLQITLVWDDFSGTANADPALINQLDLIVYDPLGHIYRPWELDPSTPTAAAIACDISDRDAINNVEQITVDNPIAGTWTVYVIGAAIPEYPQSYSLSWINGEEGHQGEITTDTTWAAADSPHIVLDNVTVGPNARLTIEAGAEVRFQSGKSLVIDGELSADNVTFTSNDGFPAAGDWWGIEFTPESKYKDSSLTNCTIEYSQYGVYLDGTSAPSDPVTLSGCTIANNSNTGIYITDASPLISGCTIKNHSTYGIYVFGIDASPTISGNTITQEDADVGQGSGIYGVGGADLSITNNEIDLHNYGIEGYSGGTPPILTITGNTIINNASSGIYLRASSTSWNGPVATINNNNIYGNTNYELRTGLYKNAKTTVLDARNNWWGTTDPISIASKIYDFSDYINYPVVDYSSFLDGPGGTPITTGYRMGWVFSDATWPVSESPIVVLGKVMVDTNAALTIESGTELKFINSDHFLEINGRLFADNVTFTSNEAFPAAGDWWGIEFTPESNYKDSSLTNCTIEYSQYGVYLDGTSAPSDPVTLSGCTIANNSNTGIYITDASPLISGCTIKNHSTYGIYVYGIDASPTISGNTITQEDADVGQGSGIYGVGGADLSITNNEIDLHNYGIEGYSGGTPPILTITGNTIINNASSGIYLRASSTSWNGPVATINNNNIYGNTNYDLQTGLYKNASATIINAERNWWGQAVPGVIDGLIYDHSDYSNCPIVDYEPYLYCPSTLEASSSMNYPICSSCNLSYSVSWEPVSGANSYLLERATNLSFDDSVVVYEGTETFHTESGVSYGSYYYRVFAVNECGGGPWKIADHRIVVAPGVEAPSEINYPAIFESGDYTVSWSSVPEALSYTLERDTGQEFNSPVIVYTGSDISFNEVNLDEGKYWYRVKAANQECYSQWTVGSHPIVPPCEGDFDIDGDVDGSDLAVFAADFGRTDCGSAPSCEGDFDVDGDVDGSDLAVFAADFGRTDCP